MCKINILYIHIYEFNITLCKQMLSVNNIIYMIYNDIVIISQSYNITNKTTYCQDLYYT